VSHDDPHGRRGRRGLSRDVRSSGAPARHGAAGDVERLHLRHPGGVTAVWAGSGALDAARPELAGWVAGRTLFVVSTPRVLALHGRRLAPLRDAAARLHLLQVPEGEAAKSPAVAERLWNEMLLAGGKRDSRLAAFGGGSAGDLGGFVAGCFLRGMFLHPAWVVCDTDLLATLPREELRSGLVEVIKAAALLDPPLLAAVESGLERLLAGDPAALAPVVAAAAAAKIAIVERDPDERGDRRLLNFGHTLGHAIESACGYQGLRHGEAVAYGMLFALRLARRRGLEEAAARRLAVLLGRLELPPLPPLAPAELLARMARDKKARERGGLVWVLPAGIGEGTAETLVEGVPWDEVEAELRGFLRQPLAIEGG
jgi:3-dehydroquinate synthetase